MKSVCQSIGESARPFNEDSSFSKVESEEFMFDMTRDNNDTLNANSSNRMGRLSPGLNTPYQVCALHTELRTNFETPISDDSRYDKAEPKEYSSDIRSRCPISRKEEKSHAKEITLHDFFLVALNVHTISELHADDSAIKPTFIRSNRTNYGSPQVNQDIEMCKKTKSPEMNMEMKESLDRWVVDSSVNQTDSLNYSYYEKSTQSPFKGVNSSRESRSRERSTYRSRDKKPRSKPIGNVSPSFMSPFMSEGPNLKQQDNAAWTDTSLREGDGDRNGNGAGTPPKEVPMSNEFNRFLEADNTNGSIPNYSNQSLFHKSRIGTHSDTSNRSYSYSDSNRSDICDIKEGSNSIDQIAIHQVSQDISAPVDVNLQHTRLEAFEKSSMSQPMGFENSFIDKSSQTKKSKSHEKYENHSIGQNNLTSKQLTDNGNGYIRELTLSDMRSDTSASTFELSSLTTANTKFNNSDIYGTINRKKSPNNLHSQFFHSDSPHLLPSSSPPSLIFSSTSNSIHESSSNDFEVISSSQRSSNCQQKRNENKNENRVSWNTMREHSKLEDMISENSGTCSKKRFEEYSGEKSLLEIVRTYVDDCEVTLKNVFSIFDSREDSNFSDSSLVIDKFETVEEKKNKKSMTEMNDVNSQENIVAELLNNITKYNFNLINKIDFLNNESSNHTSINGTSTQSNRNYTLNMDNYTNIVHDCFETLDIGRDNYLTMSDFTDDENDDKVLSPDRPKMEDREGEYKGQHEDEDENEDETKEIEEEEGGREEKEDEQIVNIADVDDSNQNIPMEDYTTGKVSICNLTIVNSLSIFSNKDLRSHKMVSYTFSYIP